MLYTYGVTLPYTYAHYNSPNTIIVIKENRIFLAHTIKSIEIVAMLFDNDSLLKLSIATFLDNDK